MDFTKNIRSSSVLIIWLSLFSGYLGYTVYLNTAEPLPQSSVTVAIRQGQQVWQNKNCQACHQLYGLGGYLGPDLTNIISQKSQGYARAFIQSGTDRMPAFHLTDAETSSLIAFLTYVDASGQNRVPASAVHWTGTYTQSLK